jgi:hypothetical protein
MVGVAVRVGVGVSVATCNVGTTTGVISGAGDDV